MGAMQQHSPCALEHDFHPVTPSSSSSKRTAQSKRTALVCCTAFCAALLLGIFCYVIAKLTKQHDAPSKSPDIPVVFGPPLSFHRCVNDSHIALTFDDGPSNKTIALLDRLTKLNVLVTFFVVGINFAVDATAARAVKRAVAAGHQVASHTWSHANLTLLDDAHIHHELHTTSDALFALTGKRPRYIRPPYGSMNATVKQTLVAEGYKPTMWSCDSNDWMYMDEASVTSTLDGCDLDGLVLLMHDGRQSTIDAVDTFIRRVRTQHPEKTFVRADECAGFPGDAYVA